MKDKKRGVYGLLALILVGTLVVSCSSESPTEPALPTPSYSFSIVAHVFPGASMTLILDSAGNPIDTTRARVYINDTPLTYFYGRFVSYIISYKPNGTYRLRAIVDNDTITASITAPALDSIRITYPTEGSVFSPGAEIPVSWTYFGDIGNGIAFVAMDYNSPDTTTYVSGPLIGTTTSDTIPSEATLISGEARISVMGGDFETIPGLLDPDPTDGIDGSYLAVYTLDEVYINIGSKE